MNVCELTFWLHVMLFYMTHCAVNSWQYNITPPFKCHLAIYRNQKSQLDLSFLTILDIARKISETSRISPNF